MAIAYGQYYASYGYGIPAYSAGYAAVPGKSIQYLSTFKSILTKIFKLSYNLLIAYGGYYSSGYAYPSMY